MSEANTTRAFERPAPSAAFKALYDAALDVVRLRNEKAAFEVQYCAVNRLQFALNAVESETPANPPVLSSLAESVLALNALTRSDLLKHKLQGEDWSSCAYRLLVLKNDTVIALGAALERQKRIDELSPAARALEQRDIDRIYQEAAKLL